MGRGRNAKDGETRTAPNGYHYTKVDGTWRLTHHLVAERKLGRALKDDERVYFKDKDRDNLSPDNLEVRPVKNGRQQRIDELRRKITIMQDELDELVSSDN
jgi:hypothetical protein